MSGDEDEKKVGRKILNKKKKKTKTKENRKKQKQILEWRRISLLLKEWIKGKNNAGKKDECEVGRRSADGGKVE